MTAETMATFHSLERAKQRAGLNERRAYKMIDLTLTRGKTAASFKSRERDYLENATQADRVAVAYNNYCYIFSENGYCLTMFPLPGWFGKKKHFAGKERIRNMKVYARYCEVV